MNDSLISSSMRRGRMRSRLFGAVMTRLHSAARKHEKGEDFADGGIYPNGGRKAILQVDCKSFSRNHLPGSISRGFRVWTGGWAVTTKSPGILLHPEAVTRHSPPPRPTDSLFTPLHPARPAILELDLHLRRVSRLELSLARECLVALLAILLVPLPRHLAGELAIAEPERERHRQRDGAEQDRERRRHDVRCDAQLLQRHEHGEQ